MGIAPEEMGRLFESFSQTASGRKVQGGTGLGLALSRQFVRLMHGELTADSTPGQGSCFTFTLPLLTADSVDSVEPRSIRNEEPALPMIQAAESPVKDQCGINYA
ncbi:MAG: hypothetical protein LM550_07875 [Candidatus Contendobacter sp.]|jgi:K+-sensing histidine kinase KdpD|nr:hypothetical protein [Gammaproteobacteria bacterium]MCC8993590.1 hypothetical protein [Candidatus Contendobacter sp.]